MGVQCWLSRSKILYYECFWACTGLFWSSEEAEAKEEKRWRREKLAGKMSCFFALSVPFLYWKLSTHYTPSTRSTDHSLSKIIQYEADRKECNNRFSTNRSVSLVVKFILSNGSQEGKVTQMFGDCDQKLCARVQSLQCLRYGHLLSQYSTNLTSCWAGNRCRLR